MAPSLVHRAFHWSVDLTSLRADKASAKHKVDMSVDDSKSVALGNATEGPTSATATAITSNAQSPKSSKTSGMTTVYIGPKQQRFKVNKKLLCAASPFFRDRIEDPTQPRSVSIWLPGESPSMFAMFVEWLHDRYNFRFYLEDVVKKAQEAGHQDAQETHWALIRLHLFASHLYILSLQDNAMDAIQDLYLKCDWDVTPGLITYLYTKCEGIPAVRLRRWAVAMVAYSLSRSPCRSSYADSSCSPTTPTSSRFDESESSDHARFHELLDSQKEFSEDYTIHIQKLQVSGLQLRSKNPQVRIPANKLRNEERANGFRECSFHSHRATVGEKRCPHERKRLLRAKTQVAELDAADKVDDDRASSLLSANWRATQDRTSCSLFRVEEEAEPEQGLKHMRSISSTLR
ncbi:unnamed protein product [Clonostachys chloroleuca]|uniref:BTB domain-containing protein n=1 Tax=Clonostachys chloroleuca TaxID=1926264 RepID=A0AA35MF28_9HYPO|nr:unnamed protein product [Clonostachys chloroleuca]